ncbi:hypothetical protein GW932_00640 [archaeon]|nr:hypothetical protein [archaeon]
MPKDQIFSSAIKYAGIFSFKDFYEFSFKWLKGEMGLTISEEEYEEKLKGNAKDIKVKWKGTAKVAEYFNFEVGITFEVEGLTEVEINQGGEKIRSNQGKIKIKITGTLIKDPKNQFETTPTMKMWRGIYEKFIIPSRIKQYEDKLVGGCDEYLAQAKAFLDLEGRK